MKLLVNTTNYAKTINIALNINEDYQNSVVFHCFWNGVLNEKHLYSILSCYYFNVHNHKHKIVLWLENNDANKYNAEISKYAEIKYFQLEDEIKNTQFIKDNHFSYNKELSFYSDVVRYLLLYNYGGCWFDLDCLFLRRFDPIFYNYGSEICVYQWATKNYPNGAIYISLKKQDDKMRKNIEYIMNCNRGWGFQEADLTYDLPLDLLVLPCSWFNGCWITNPHNIYVNMPYFFGNTNMRYTFNNFFKGSFCFHWHNRWDVSIHDNSIFNQLIQIIKNDLKNENERKIY